MKMFLLLVLILSLVLSCLPASADTVREAEYPSFAPYPENPLDENYGAQVEAWEDSLAEMRSHAGAGSGLENFTLGTARAFLTGTGNENAVYSPLCLFEAMAALAEITDGSARAELLALTGSESIEVLREKARALFLANCRDDGLATSLPSASLWLSDSCAWKEAVLDTLAEKYFASSYSGRMGSEELNGEYRAWLNEHTGNRLADTVNGLSLSEENIASLLTAIYFKASWLEPFETFFTRDDIFHAPDGDLSCPFMAQRLNAGTVYADSFRAVRLRLGGDAGNMWFILPREGLNPAELLLNDETLGQCVAAGFTSAEAEIRDLLLRMPRFDVKSSTPLNAGLASLGVQQVFSSLADFSPLTDGPMFLSSALHVARVTVDEDGVEAAAFTQLVMDAGAAEPTEPEEFIIDRPFLFVLTGWDGLPLFVGIVNHPN